MRELPAGEGERKRSRSPGCSRFKRSLSASRSAMTTFERTAFAASPSHAKSQRAETLLSLIFMASLRVLPRRIVLAHNA
eukprot:4070890-Heterocapsa_arctica.AAC.1